MECREVQDIVEYVNKILREIHALLGFVVWGMRSTREMQGLLKRKIYVVSAS